jgi:hypothetical protein
LEFLFLFNLIINDLQQPINSVNIHKHKHKHIHNRNKNSKTELQAKQSNLVKKDHKHHHHHHQKTKHQKLKYEPTIHNKREIKYSSIYEGNNKPTKSISKNTIKPKNKQTSSIIKNVIKNDNELHPNVKVIVETQSKPVSVTKEVVEEPLPKITYESKEDNVSGVTTSERLKSSASALFAAILAGIDTGVGKAKDTAGYLKEKAQKMY